MRYSLAVYNIFKCTIPFSRQYLGKLEEAHDFVLLQEWVSTIHAKKHEHLISNTTFFLPFRGDATGTAILSKYKPVSYVLATSLSREFGVFTRKSVIISTFYIRDKEVTLFNCHALNFVPTVLWKKTMNAWLNRLPKSGATVVAGDFNTWSRARFQYLQVELEKREFRYAEYTEKKLMRLDHVWYRDIFDVSCRAHTGVHVSDHYPLSLEFSL